MFFQHRKFFCQKQSLLTYFTYLLELSLYGGSDLDEQVDQLVDTTNSQKVNFSNNDESELEGSDKDDLIKGIANDFSAVEKRSTSREKLGQYNK